MIFIYNTHIRQNGRKLTRAVIVILAFIFAFSGCIRNGFEGEGRGDWYLDLCNGYRIDRVNSGQIVVIYNIDQVNSGGSIVLKNFFVTAYQIHEPYICVEGIQTQNPIISEDELNCRTLSYYMIDSDSGNILGPFDTDKAFGDFDTFSNANITAGWIKIGSQKPDGAY